MGKAPTSREAALYTSEGGESIDADALRNALYAIGEHHEGVRRFCKAIVAESNTFEEASFARVIAAAMDAATKHINALYPS